MTALEEGRRTQTRRRELKAWVKVVHPLEEDEWYELIEDRAVAKLPVWDVIGWVPHLGQGHDGADTVRWRILNDAGVAPSRLCGELTLRQASAVVRAALNHQPRRS